MLPYPKMKTEDICALPVAELADNNCNLFLWTTHTFLPDAFKVMRLIKIICLYHFQSLLQNVRVGVHKKAEAVKAISDVILIHASIETNQRESQDTGGISF